MFALEQRVGAAWEHRYSLISDGLSDEATWHSADEEPVFDRDVQAFAGSERVRIPEEVTAGTWRICTTGWRENVCARLEIEGERS